MAKATKVKIVHPCLNDSKHEIPKWRRNKIFCNEICKNEYHNKNRTILDANMKHIHGILGANYDILKKVIGDNETIIVEYKILKDLNFDFQFNTQTVGDYHNIYTLSWLKLGSGEYKISQVPFKTYRGGYTIK